MTSQSLEKIEDGSVFSFANSPTRTDSSTTAVYAIVVRGSEYNIPPDMLDDIIAQSISASDVKSRAGHRDAGSGNEYEDDTRL